MALAAACPWWTNGDQLTGSRCLYWSKVSTPQRWRCRISFMAYPSMPMGKKHDFLPLWPGYAYCKKTCVQCCETPVHIAVKHQCSMLSNTCVYCCETPLSNVVEHLCIMLCNTCVQCCGSPVFNVVEQLCNFCEAPVFKGLEHLCPMLWNTWVQFCQTAESNAKVHMCSMLWKTCVQYDKTFYQPECLVLKQWYDWWLQWNSSTLAVTLKLIKLGCWNFIWN